MPVTIPCSPLGRATAAQSILRSSTLPGAWSFFSPTDPCPVSVSRDAITKKTLNVRDEKIASKHKHDEAELRHRRRDAMITEQVLHELGRPPGLHAVQVRHLWADCLRVNVML